MSNRTALTPAQRRILVAMQEGTTLSLDRRRGSYTYLLGQTVVQGISVERLSAAGLVRLTDLTTLTGYYELTERGRSYR